MLWRKGASLAVQVALAAPLIADHVCHQMNECKIDSMSPHPISSTWAHRVRGHLPSPWRKQTRALREAGASTARVTPQHPAVTRCCKTALARAGGKDKQFRGSGARPNSNALSHAHASPRQRVEGGCLAARQGPLKRGEAVPTAAGSPCLVRAWPAQHHWCRQPNPRGPACASAWAGRARREGPLRCAARRDWSGPRRA